MIRNRPVTRRWISCSVIVIFALLTAAAAGADGCFVARGSIHEPSQTACLIWDEDTGLEELILQVNYEYHGDGEDFAWLVPVPSLPELGVVDAVLFPQLYALTDPVRRERRSACSRTYDQEVVYAPDANDGVQVISEETVGIYQTMILAADDAAALADSLTQWGYLEEFGDHDALMSALQFYIDKSWYFVTMRTDTLGGEPDEYLGYYSGSLEPVSLTFSCDEPIYPLRISRFSSYLSTVHLFTVAHRRLDFPGAVCQYANSVTADERAEIVAVFPELSRILPEPAFLTKLVADMSFNDMEDDIHLTPAPLNQEYLQFRYSGLPVVEILFLLSVGFLGFRHRREPLPKEITKG